MPDFLKKKSEYFFVPNFVDFVSEASNRRRPHNDSKGTKFRSTPKVDFRNSGTFCNPIFDQFSNPIFKAQGDKNKLA